MRSLNTSLWVRCSTSSDRPAPLPSRPAGLRNRGPKRWHPAARPSKPFGLDSPAAEDQTIGSPVLQQLYAKGDTEPGVTYTNIVTRTDVVVTPYTNQFLTAGPGATVHNILLQNVRPLDLTGHLGSPYDPNVCELVLNALDPVHARPVRCALMPLPV
ncbi:hypothetical protein ACWCRD_15820 [Streptomyces sp. NPDC002092]